MSSNNAVIFCKVPEGYPVAGEHLKFEKRPYSFGEPAKDELIVANIYASIDPYLRGKMRAPEKKSYSPPFVLNEPMQNHIIGKVYKSNNPAFSEGDLVFGFGDWAEYTHFGAQQAKGLTKIDNSAGIPLSNFIGAVGMPGMTAYSSIYEIGKPKKGETIFISAASGAVGQIVGQIAKREGLTVVGSAGTDAKVAYLKELGFDRAYNYKTEAPAEALSKYCPDGIDIYYENVGGETLDAVLNHCNTFARIVACGMISQYNTSTPYGVTSLMKVVAQRITMRGFIVGDPDFWPKYAKSFYSDVPKWLASGEIKYREDIADGLEEAPAKFVGMLKGENFGKTIIKIRDE